MFCVLSRIVVLSTKKWCFKGALTLGNSYHSPTHWSPKIHFVWLVSPHTSWRTGLGHSSVGLARSTSSVITNWSQVQNRDVMSVMQLTLARTYVHYTGPAPGRNGLDSGKYLTIIAAKESLWYMAAVQCLQEENPGTTGCNARHMPETACIFEKIHNYFLIRLAQLTENPYIAYSVNV